MDCGNISTAVEAPSSAERHRSRCVDVGMQLFAVLALTCGVTLIGVAFIGESTRAEHMQLIESRKPKPNPQMMTPGERPPLNSNGMIYAVGTTYVDGRGGY